MTARANRTAELKLLIELSSNQAVKSEWKAELLRHLRAPQPSIEHPVPGGDLADSHSEAGAPNPTPLPFTPLEADADPLTPAIQPFGSGFT